MITFRPVDPTRWTSRTLNSSSSPNNTDVASDMLVASLLDVVEDQQHVGATSLSTATTRASRHPAQVRRDPLRSNRDAPTGAVTRIDPVKSPASSGSASVGITDLKRDARTAHNTEETQRMAN